MSKVADPNHKQPLYNIRKFPFKRLLAGTENIASNLVAYIDIFSTTAREIFEKFKFSKQIETLNNSNRLFKIVQQMSTVNLQPVRVDNLQMGCLFEHLAMRFNKQANEEAGDHFTPHEVIQLMANPIYTGDF